MKIWIDGYEANVPQRLGSSQVAYELIRSLEKLDQKNEYTIFLPSSPMEDMPQEREGWKYKILRPSKLWTRITLPFALYFARIKPDLFFSPTHYVPRFCPVPKVVTIFDLSFLQFPEMFNKGDLYKLTNWTKFSVLNSQHVLTISNFTKKDLIKQYKLKADKITIFYPGFDQTVFRPIKNSSQIKKIQDKYGIVGRYIIFIGTIQPKKNIIRLMEAVKNIEDLKLVVVGKTTGPGREAWQFQEILQTPQKLDIPERVIFPGFVPTEELPCLLSGAAAFVLPSLWEGFGIPVVEAMATGTPVVVSNVSSLPEVVGKAGLLIDPYSVTQIEQAIRAVINDKKLNEALSKLGLQQAQKYSWETAAKVVLSTFTKLVKEA
ncbi:MAG: glycosyltransferase family 4 protein [Candidatus Daviesbacteria bacterium]|nr:MAG: glycosyltransferase family 4 protein [Candidatus Daviesbacteria bacterium]